MDERCIKGANRLLYLGLIIGLIVSLVLHKYLYAICFFASALALTIIFQFIKKKNLPEYFKLILTIFIWLNLIGEIGRIYYIFGYYDKILHFIVPFALCYILAKYVEGTKIGLVAVFLMVMGFTALFEMYEFVVQITTGIPMMGVLINGNWEMSALTDTMIDLGLGGLSSIIYLTIHKIRARKKLNLFPKY